MDYNIQIASRDASWLLATLADEPDKAKCRLHIPETIVFREDPSTRRLVISKILRTNKNGFVIQMDASEAGPVIRKLKDKQAAAVAAGPSNMNVPIATAYGFDSVGQGVPPAGLENLLSDIESGNLDGITMLQLRPPVVTKAKGRNTNAYRIDVEFISDTPGKPSIKIRLGEGEKTTPTTTTILKSLREELVNTVKRIVQHIERKGCRFYTCTFEFAYERSRLQLLRGRDIKTSSFPHEMEPGTQGVQGSTSPMGMPHPTGSTDGSGSPGPHPHQQYQRHPQPVQPGAYLHTTPTPLSVLDINTPLSQAIHAPLPIGNTNTTIPAFTHPLHIGAHVMPQPNTLDALPRIDPAVLAEVQLGPSDKENATRLAQQLRRAQDALREIQAVAAKSASMGAPAQTHGTQEITESAALKQMRKKGNFEYSEDPLPPENSPNREKSLTDLLMKTRKKWKDAVAYVDTVTSAVLREKHTAIMEMSSLHKQEVQQLRASIATLEDRLLQFQAEANNLSTDLNASIKREEYTSNRLTRAQNEVKRLHNDLQTIIALQSGPGSNSRTPAAAHPSGRRPAFPPATTPGASGPLGSKSGANIRAGAEIVGGGAPLPSPASGAGISPTTPATMNYLSPTADIQTVFSASDQGAIVAGLHAHLRQLQAEIAGLREEMAGEVSRNAQLKSSHAKTLEEFRAERRRLLALLAEKDTEQEYKTIQQALEAESNSLEQSNKNRTTAGDDEGGNNSDDTTMDASVPIGELLRRSREINALRSTVATLRTELTHALDNQKQADRKSVV